jgi:hypothetical protein
MNNKLPFSGFLLILMYVSPTNKNIINFSPEMYLQLNPDIKEHPHYSLYPLEHYLEFGLSEKRICQYEQVPDLLYYFNWIKMNNKLPFTGFSKKSLFNKNYLVDKNIIFYENDNNNNMLSTSYLTQDENINETTFDSVINTQYYILVIDFPQYGGGTTHFINTIIEKYKSVQTFLLARNINGKIQLTINNTNLNRKFKNKEAIAFFNYKNF